MTKYSTRPKKSLQNYIIQISLQISIIFCFFSVNAFSQEYGIIGFRGTNTSTLWRYNIQTDQWLTTAAYSSDLLTSAPANIGDGGASVGVYDNIYVIRGGTTSEFWRYSVTTNSWDTLTSTPGNIAAGGAITHLNGFLYVLAGNSTAFYRYNINNNTWSTLANYSGGNVAAGGSLTTDGTLIYATRGNGTREFRSFNPSNNTWSTLSDYPQDLDNGTALTFNGTNIYGIRGGGNRLYRYNSNNTWTEMQSNNSNHVAGASIIAYDGFFYVFRGNSTIFRRYDVPNDSWIDRSSVASNVGSGASLSLFSPPVTDIAIEKTITNMPMGGFSPLDTVIYQLKVSNIGTDFAVNVVITDTLSSFLEYVSHSGGNYNSNTGIFTIGNLSSGKDTSVFITAKIKPANQTAGVKITNVASVSGGYIDTISSNNVDSVSLLVDGADLGIIVNSNSSSNPIVEGSFVDFIIKVYNNGPNNADSIQVTSPLLFNLIYQLSSTNYGSYNQNNGIWNLGTLIAGDTATLIVSTRVREGGILKWSASITNSTENDALLSNNSDVAKIVVPKTFEAGACIVDLGITSSYNAGLKPYGLVYDLVKNYDIPVYWAINPDKSFVSATSKEDQVDFSVNGVDYRTGAFIISKEFKDLPIVDSIINDWVTKNSGLTVRCSLPAFNAPIHGKIAGLSNCALDSDNGSLAVSAFFANNRAGITQFYNASDPDNSPYYIKTPLQLSPCDDIYIMPHADPDKWNTATQTAFNTFIDSSGWLYGACHAPSSLETLYNGGAGLRLLSTNGINTSSKSGSKSYSYGLISGQYYDNMASDPYLQFMGITSPALSGGSQEIYPPLSGGWRTTTTVAMWQTNHPANIGTYPTGVAAALVYGRAFGNPNLGMVLYQGSHTFASGSIAENIGAARVLGNLWLDNGIEMAPRISPQFTLDNTYLAGGQVELPIGISSKKNASLQSVEWTSSCGGVFQLTDSLSPLFTFPNVSSESTCIITVKVVDVCGRSSFETFTMNVVPSKTNPDVNITFVNTSVPGDVSTNDKIPAGTNYKTINLLSSPTNSNPIITIDSTGKYIFQSDKAGVYEYDVEVCRPSDNSPCETERLTITVLDETINSNKPVANTDIAITMQGVPVTLNSLKNDAAGNKENSLVPSTVTIVSGTEPDSTTEGTLSVNTTTGEITFTPVASFFGVVSYQYEVCDDQIPPACAVTLQEITVLPPSPFNSILAADDYVSTKGTRPVSGNVLDNDFDPEGDSMIVTPQTVTIDSIGTLILNSDGTFTFTAVQDFVGPVNFPYTVCDDQLVPECAQATLYILVYPDNTIIPVLDYNTTYVNTDVSGNVRTNDIDPEGDTITLTLIGNLIVGGSPVTVNTAEGGSIEMDSLGNYTYTPANNFVGQDSILYTICDDGNPQACGHTTLYLTVLPLPTPWDPSSNLTIANPDQGVSYGNPITLDLLANDKDPEEDEQEFKGVKNPNNGQIVTNGTINNIPGTDADGNAVSNAGSLSINTDGTVVFTPTEGFRGTINTLEYFICDTVSAPHTACDKSTIRIQVVEAPNGEDLPPFAGDDYAIARFMNRPVVGNWLANDSDPDVDTLNDRITVNGKSVIINPNVPTGTGQPIDTMTTDEGGTVILLNDGSFIYNPPTDFIGPDQVVYEICDTVAPIQCDQATIYLFNQGLKTSFGDLTGIDTMGSVFIDFDGNGKPDGSNALWLGETILARTDSTTNNDASYDLGDDGLIIPSQLDSTMNNIYRAVVSSNESGVVAYVRLLIDWNNDKQFDNVYTLSITTTSSGSDTLDFSVVLPPGLGANATVNYRVMVSNDPADFDRQMMNNGEVEDYQVGHAQPVPVSLINFDAVWRENIGVVYWSTTMELNNSHFKLYRSFDGKNYDLLGIIKSKALGGNSNEILSYTYMDKEVINVIRNNAYYRLIQYDFDGTNETFGPVVLSVSNKVLGDYHIYPNPTKDVMNYTLSEMRNGKVEVNLLTNFGQVVYHESLNVDSEIVNGQIDVSGLRNGMYYVQFSQYGIVQKTIRIVVAR
jgi:uncharacterized repeat protein (TIGR01451 family)